MYMCLYICVGVYTIFVRILEFQEKNHIIIIIVAIIKAHLKKEVIFWNTYF